MQNQDCWVALTISLCKIVHYCFPFGASMKPSLLLLLLTIPCAAFAQSTKSSSLSNTATVLSACSISTTDNLNFGTFNPLDPQELRGTGSVSVSCTYGTYGLSISNGSGGNSFLYNSVALPSTGGGGYNVTYGCWRGMTNAAGKKLYYELYSDSGYTKSSINTGTTSYTSSAPTNSTTSSSACGTSVNSFTTVSFTNNTPKDVIIYGKVNITKGRPKELQPGSYSDQVVVNVNF